jgi:hypothetical protein
MSTHTSVADARVCNRLLETLRVPLVTNTLLKLVKDHDNTVLAGSFILQCVDFQLSEEWQPGDVDVYTSNPTVLSEFKRQLQVCCKYVVDDTSGLNSRGHSILSVHRWYISGHFDLPPIQLTVLRQPDVMDYVATFDYRLLRLAFDGERLRAAPNTTDTRLAVITDIIRRRLCASPTFDASLTRTRARRQAKYVERGFSVVENLPTTATPTMTKAVTETETAADTATKTAAAVETAAVNTVAVNTAIETIEPPISTSRKNAADDLFYSCFSPYPAAMGRAYAALKAVHAAERDTTTETTATETTATETTATETTATETTATETTATETTAKTPTAKDTTGLSLSTRRAADSLFYSCFSPDPAAMGRAYAALNATHAAKQGTAQGTKQGTVQGTKQGIVAKIDIVEKARGAMQLALGELKTELEAGPPSAGSRHAIKAIGVLSERLETVGSNVLTVCRVAT